MSTIAARSAPADRPVLDRAARPLLIVLGVTQVAQGLFMVIAPHSFYDLIANFGAYNAHDFRDNATAVTALGVMLLVAAGRPAWRAPICGVAALATALHALNHIVDVGKADKLGVGIFDAVSLAGLAIVYLAIARTPAR
jgi:hypothetical protein